MTCCQTARSAVRSMGPGGSQGDRGLLGVGRCDDPSRKGVTGKARRHSIQTWCCPATGLPAAGDVRRRSVVPSSPRSVGSSTGPPRGIQPKSVADGLRIPRGPRRTRPSPTRNPSTWSRAVGPHDSSRSSASSPSVPRAPARRSGSGEAGRCLIAQPAPSGRQITFRPPSHSRSPPTARASPAFVAPVVVWSRAAAPHASGRARSNTRAFAHRWRRRPARHRLDRAVPEHGHAPPPTRRSASHD